MTNWIAVMRKVNGECGCARENVLKINFCGQELWRPHEKFNFNQSETARSSKYNESLALTL